MTTIEGNDKKLLNLKQGEVYLAEMTSEDVTHAPWFVSMGIKEDIMPSQVTKQWLIADEVEDCLLV